MKRKTKPHKLPRYLRKYNASNREKIQCIRTRLLEFLHSEAEQAAYKAWLGKSMCCR